VALLASKATDFADGHSMDALFRKGILDVFQLEVTDDRFDFLHGSAPGTRTLATPRDVGKAAALL
jgi:hypothetical protein